MAVTAEQAEGLIQRTTRSLRRLSPAQRDLVIARIVQADPEVADAAPTVLALCERTRRLHLPLRRDSVM